jgi:signal transduction histidine kinase
MRNKLIPMIAHDIRSPLASLQNTLSLTRENILNPEEFQKLSFALEADIYNLRGMLDNMLLWAREQIVEIRVNKSRFNLSTMVQDVILMHRNSLITKNINIHNYLLHDLEVFSDKEMLTAVLRNIFSNAVKFTEPGKNIYINQIFLNKKIYLSVKDEGKGISEEILDKINNKEHISTRGTANEKGTGIGIIFSKELLTNLGEQFDITSVPAKGTSVTFSICMLNSENGTIQTKIKTG